MEDKYADSKQYELRTRSWIAHYRAQGDTKIAERMENALNHALKNGSTNLPQVIETSTIIESVKPEDLKDIAVSKPVPVKIRPGPRPEGMPIDIWYNREVITR